MGSVSDLSIFFNVLLNRHKRAHSPQLAAGYSSIKNWQKVVIDNPSSPLVKNFDCHRE
jgi:hypothetical protein